MDNVNSPVLLNLGCGFNKLPGHINVDAFDICEPDDAVPEAVEILR